MTSSTDDALILDDLDPSTIAVGRGRRTSKVHTLDKVTQQVIDKPPAKHLAAKELAARELARRHFLPFVVRTHPGYIVEWFHEDLAARLERFVRRVENKQSPRLLISVPPRRGKEIADHVPVLTTRGWVKHGDLRPGDFVFHPSGEPTEVLEVHPPGIDTMEVELTTGEVIQCHENHEWTVRDKAHGRWMTVETRWFLDPIPKGGHRGKRRNLWHGKRGSRGGRAAFQLPFVEPLQFPEADLPMDPYVLGAWLGDGTTAGCAITHHADDTEVVRAIVDAGYAVSSCAVHRTTGVHTTRFGGARPIPGRMTQDLRRAGVWDDKHIPGEYMRGSVEQRLQLLAGLIDTDGHVDATGRIGFANVNKRLAYDVAALVRTFGWYAGIHERAPKLSSSGIQGKRTIYEVRFRPTMLLPLRIPRKALAQTSLQRRRRIGIRDVRRAKRPAVGRCITVAAPDGLYLVGEHLIPTHNSQQASKAMPAWFLGRNPRGSIIATTHSDDLANDNSRDVLDILKSTAYQTVFPDLQLHKDNKGATGWRTTQGGRYKPAGVGKGISGRGADIFLVDDPHRDKDAYSPAVRDAIWRWYKSSARTRLMPGGGMCVIQTRWVKDDLIGRLIEEEGLIEEGGEWEYICYPEEATEDEYRLPDGRIVHEPMEGAKLLRRKGECLSPKRYPPESNLEHKRDPVTWAALYQQNPVSGESAMFDEGMFPGYTTLPSDLRRYSTWDLAVGQQDRNDWTVGVVFGVDPENTIYIIDVLRQRIAPDDLVDLMIDTHLEHRTELDGVEKGHIQMSIGPFFETRLSERRVYDMTLMPMPTGNRDKIARARSIQGRMRQGKVLFDRNAAWFDQLRQEMLDFPAGRHDDVVDAMAWVGLLLDEIGRQAPPPPKRRTQSWRDQLKTGARRKKSWLAA